MSRALARTLARWFPTPAVWGLTFFSFGALAVAWALALWKLPGFAPTPDTLISLHYNVYLGVDEVGRWQQGLLIPATASLTVLLAPLVAKHEQGVRPVFAALIRVTAVLVACATVAALFFILVANV